MAISVILNDCFFHSKEILSWAKVIIVSALLRNHNLRQWVSQFYRKIRPYSRIKEFSGLLPYPVSLPDVAAALPVSKSETFGVFGGNSAALVLASLPSMIIWGGKKRENHLLFCV